MNLTALKTWVSGETLTATDLNGEFQNIYTHTITNSDIDSTGTYVLGELVVGSGITAADGGQFHVHTASAGSVQAHADANEAVLENSAASGLSILSGSSSDGNIFFGDAADNDVGKIAYSHSANSLAFTTNGATALTLSSAQAATFAGDVSVGGALTLTGGLTLNGAVVVGDSASDTLTVNATVTSDLLFTDATYDIGKSGATRPRDGFFSRNMAVGGTLGVTGATTLSSTLGVTGALTATAGITSGSDIVSDSDSTDDLGTTSVRWANLYVDSIGDTGQALAITAGSNNVNVTAGTLALTGAQTISSTLGVTGLITASGGVSGTTGTFSGATTVGSAGATADFAVWTDGTSSTAAGFTVDASADEVIVGQLSGGGNTTFKVRNRLNNTVFLVTPDAPSTTVFAPNIATGSAGTLTVKTGSINSDSIRLEAGGTTSTWLESRGYLGHSWYVDSTRSMTLDSAGLGINTASPNAPLAVASTASTYEGMELVTPSGDGSGKFQFGVHQSGSTAGRGIEFRRGGSDGFDTLSLAIDNAGNIGLGVTPSGYYANKLVVSAGNQDGITIAASATSDYNNIFFADGTSGTSTYRGQIMYGHTNDEMKFATAAQTALTIDSSQRVGIGTSSPTGTLQVKAATNSNLRFYDSSGRFIVEAVNDAVSNNTDLVFSAENLDLNTNGASALYIDSSQRVIVDGVFEGSPKYVGTHVKTGSNTVSFTLSCNAQSSIWRHGYILIAVAGGSNASVTPNTTYALYECQADTTNPYPTLLGFKGNMGDSISSFSVSLSSGVLTVADAGSSWNNMICRVEFGMYTGNVGIS